MSALKLNYPFNDNAPDHSADMVGQVVGPNWLGEFFVITNTKNTLAQASSTSTFFSQTEATLELLTKDRQDLLTVEHRRMFADRVMADKERNDAAGIEPIPEWREIGDLERFVKSPNFFSLGLGSVRGR